MSNKFEYDNIQNIIKNFFSSDDPDDLINNLEKLIIEETKKIILNILNKKPSIKIGNTGRIGAQISQWIQDEFVNYIKIHKPLFFKNPESSPSKKTKSNWDAKFLFSIKNILEIPIWIDFKTFKKNYNDSNPDMGTPKKFFDFLLNEDGFYIMFIYLFYESVGDQINFINYDEKNKIKIYFLKDISSSFRRNPKNQIQVNVKESPDLRSRKAFIDILIKKLGESYERQIKIAQTAIKKLPEEAQKAIEKNKKQEKIILDKIKKLKKD